jgi:fucose permease
MNNTQTPSFQRNSFTWLAYLLLAFYGYFLNILGPITPFLKNELNLSYTVSSLHFTAFAVGMLLTGLGGHLVIQRTGRWRALWLGAFGLGISALVLITGRTPTLTIGASFCMGLIGSLILIIIPSALSDQHGESRAVALSEANVIASLVSTVAPLMVGWTAALPGSWRLALGIAALAPLLMRFGFGKPALPQSTAPDVGSASKLPVLFWVYWLAIFFAVAVEFCMISWSADYLETGLGIPRVNAAQAVSLFLGAMILGRIAASRLVQRFPVHRVVLTSIGLAALGFALFWLTNTSALALSGLFVTGLGVAGLYPLLLSLAIGASNGNTTQASARASLASGMAILMLPLVLGRLADMNGIRQAYGVVGILLVSVFVIAFATRKKSAAANTSIVVDADNVT